MMKKRSILSLLLALVLCLGVFAPATLAEDVIKVGGLAVLSGPAAVYGQAVQKGVDLYIEQLNAAGGIDGKKVEVIWEDTTGDATIGLNAYNKLVENDGVTAIIGPVLTGVTKTVAEFAADIGLPMITPSATAYDITTGRPSVFRTCFLDPFQATQLARYAKDEGIAKVAILYDNGNEYSKGLYEAFVKECEVLGIEIVATESATYEDVDFKAQLTSIKNATPEAVFLPYYGAQAALILTQANEIGFATKFLGADGIADIVPAISNKALLTSITYSDHFSTQADSQMAKDFVAAYKAKYGEEPTVSFAATGYDAALVLTDAFKKGSLEYADVTAAIKATDVEGVSGKITFNEHNDPIKSAFILTFNAEGNKVFIKMQNP
ncbi:MAG: ABC transporter substrate-binding protein [Clostridiales bacterium]|nr:ABC transporter substrate-binding protein [Clostridiales bacterium]